MKYDDASWHYGGDFPSDLPPEAGATHIGMFVAWAFLIGLSNPEHDFDLLPLEKRSITPGAYLIKELDEKFVEDMLSTQGRKYASLYYHTLQDVYIQDYERAIPKGGPTLYHVRDSWENFDRLKPILDQRYQQIKSGMIPIKRMKGFRGVVQRVGIKVLSFAFRDAAKPKKP